jgi:hypothetical protein
MMSQKGISQVQIGLRFGQLTIQRLTGEIEFKTILSNQELAERGGLTQSKLASLENASRGGGEKSVSQYSYFSKPALSQTKSTLESNIRSFQSLQQSGTGKGYINAAYNQQAS